MSCQNSSADECWYVWMSLLNAICLLHDRGVICFFQMPTLLTTDFTVDALMISAGTVTSIGPVMMVGLFTESTLWPRGSLQ